jgi:hypothetical protein
MSRTVAVFVADSSVRTVPEHKVRPGAGFTFFAAAIDRICSTHVVDVTAATLDEGPGPPPSTAAPLLPQAMSSTSAVTVVLVGRRRTTLPPR